MAKGRERTEAEALRLIQPLIPHLENGVSFLHACNVTKIPIKSVQRYIDKYESVDMEIRSARSVAITDAADTLHKAAKTDWKPAVEVLKRRDAKDWGDKQDVTTGGEKLPTPILGGISAVPGDDSNKKDPSDK